MCYQNRCEIVLNIAHEGHLVLSKTKALIREKTWFPKVDKLTEELIISCLPCQLVGLPKPPAPLQPTQLPAKPWHTVNMDFLGPLPSGEMLLIIIDQHSRFPEVEILRFTAASAAIPKLNPIFARHRYPIRVRTDNGPPWNSTEIDTYMHRNGIQFKPCTPLHPRVFPSGGTPHELCVPLITAVSPQTIRLRMQTLLSY